MNMYWFMCCLFDSFSCSRSKTLYSHKLMEKWKKSGPIQRQKITTANMRIFAQRLFCHFAMVIILHTTADMKPHFSPFSRSFPCSFFSVVFISNVVIIHNQHNQQKFCWSKLKTIEFWRPTEWEREKRESTKFAVCIVWLQKCSINVNQLKRIDGEKKE